MSLDYSDASGGAAGTPEALQEVPLARNRDYRILMLGQCLSALGGGISYTLLPLIVADITRSGAQTGLVGTLESMPHLLFGLLAGVAADRWSRWRIMVYADAGRALLTLLLPLTLLLSLPFMPVLYTVIVPITTLGVFFVGAYQAWVPSVVGINQVGAAIAYGEAVLAGGFIVGSALAGLLMVWVGPGPTLALDAFSFMISVATLLALRHRSQGTVAPRATTSVVLEMKEAISFIHRLPALRSIIVLWAFINFARAPMVAASTFYVTIDRHKPASHFGIFIASFMGGFIFGGIAAGRVKQRAGLAMLAGNVVTGVAIMLMPLVGSYGLMILLALLAGASNSFVLSLYLSLRTKLTPDKLLGRVGATARFLLFALSSVGSLAGGLVIDAAGGSGALYAIGAVMILLSALFALVPSLRNARPPEAAVPAS
ncbi:MFS transporter [Sorangium sp. KYC3313]|uniref:MFS transporter n=1 Tax=Sorangium sp. KYC3313 TaxID=3449740 RepID=UPI003F89B5E4